MKCIHGKPITNADGTMRGFTSANGTGFTACGKACKPCIARARRNGHTKLDRGKIDK